MQFSITTAITGAALLSTALANPITPKRDVITFRSADSSINDCGDSTFINQSSGGSPLISDCQQIATNIAGGGTWTVITGAQHQLVQYGTCAFGVTVGPTDGWYGKIGNQDIMDLINSSIQQFSWEGLVGAEGNMNCQGGIIGGVPVNWGLYHT